MDRPTEPEFQDNPQWRDTLMGVHPMLKRMRNIFRHIPSDPRCKMCNSPQGGIGGPIVQLFGYGRYPPNPQLCQQCFRFGVRFPGGAEIELTALFADVRGSTGIAERIGPVAFSNAINDYVRTASHAIREPGGLVDRLLGDGIMALFIPGFTGGEHAAKAIEAARQIVRGADLPVGVGCHTGTAWAGFIGGVDDVRDFTALGDAVNVASRLGSQAGAGEILISASTASAASLSTAGLAARRLDLRGRSEPLEVWAEQVPDAVLPAS